MRPWQHPGFGQGPQPLPLGDGWWRIAALPATCDGSIEVPEALVPAGHLPDGTLVVQPRRDFLAQLRADPEAFAQAAPPLAALAAGIQASRATPPRPAEWMAILNLTPDSFSDGGQLEAREPLHEAASLAQRQGAAWLDLGAESTRPGAAPIPDAAQLDRLLPAIEDLLPLGVPLSVDTRSAAVAESCLQAGASMINDVSGLADPEMASVVAAHGAALVLMHMRGTPATMAERANYSFLLGEVADQLAAAAAAALAAGVAPDRLMLDPGIGFAKTAAQSRALLAEVGALRALGFPLLVGPSRKSFQADLLPERGAAERDCGTIGAASSCIQQGVTTLRLHSGRYWDAARVAAGIADAARSHGSLGSVDWLDPQAR